MKKLNQTTKTQLDKEAIEKFRNKEKQTLSIPESIKEEYRMQDDEDRKRRQRIKVMVDKGPPLQQYTDATGYLFSWGHILERRVAQFVIWDFCLTHLLSRYRAEQSSASLAGWKSPSGKGWPPTRIECWSYCGAG